IWGWFDLKDGREWPAQTHVEAVPVASASAPKPSSQPAGLSLDKLNLRFEGNVYFAGPGQGWFEWGVTWGRHEEYATLAEFQSRLHIDQGSAIVQPDFGDPAARDYRLAAAMMEKLRESYPQPPVPGVLLGVHP